MQKYVILFSSFVHCLRELIVTDKSKVEWQLHFLEWKTCSFVLTLVPRTLKITFLGLWNFKIFWGSTSSDTPLPPPPPFLKKGTNGSLLIQSVTVFKPAGFFTFNWNPWTIVCYTAIFCIATKHSSPQTAAGNQTAFLSLCVWGLTNKPIMYKKLDKTSERRCETKMLLNFH